MKTECAVAAAGHHRPPVLLLTWLTVCAVHTVYAMPPQDLPSMRAGVGFNSQTSSPSPTSTLTTPTAKVDVDVGMADERIGNRSTRKPYNCSESHRPHRNDSNKFQVRHNSVWWDQVCQTGLVWNQTLCRCDYQPGLEGAGHVLIDCPDYRQHGNASGKYEQRVNGAWLTRDCNLAVSGLIWNQTACRCVWGPDGDQSLLNFERSTPCDMMLNVTFEDGLVDEAKSSFLELTSGSTLALRHYRSRGGQRNKAAYFEDATLTVWYFAGNEMSGSLRLELRFKAEDSPLTKDRYQILLSNGCNVTGVGYTTPSLAIGYRASDRSFLLAMHTSNVRKAIVCTRDLEPFSWHQVSLIYEDGTLLFRVDNHPCIISNDFAGDVQKTACPLTIGADPLEKESKYIGYMDDVMVARYCRRFVEQALVPEKRERSNNDVINDDDPDGTGPLSLEDKRQSENRLTEAKVNEGKVKDDKIQPYRAMGALV